MKLDCILLVDDDPISIFINKRLLAKLNVSKKIVERKNGQEAFQFLEEYCNKNKGTLLVLLDLMMPVIDGYEFIKTFHESDFENKENVKIKVLTDFVSDLHQERINDIYEYPIVPKPLTVEKLEHILVEKPK